MIVPACELMLWRAPWPLRAWAALAAAAAWLAVFSPQMAVWHVLYGRAFTVPQGPSFLQWTSPHPFAVLLSDNHGLFTWAPVLVLAVAGLAQWLRRTPAVAVQIALVVLLSWYVNAAVADWWAGEAFGARRFLSLLPLFVVGLAVWIQPARAALPGAGRLWLLLALAVAHGLLLLQYQLFMKGLDGIAPYPHGGYDMWVVRWLVPFRVIAWWAS
jgi:hypothetical protein